MKIDFNERKDVNRWVYLLLWLGVWSDLISDVLGWLTWSKDGGITIPVYRAVESLETRRQKVEAL